MTPAEELRSLKLQLTGIDKLLGDLRTEEQEHPEKAVAGSKAKDVAKWVAIRDGIAKRREPLVKEREKLLARRSELSNAFPNITLKETSIRKVIHELMDIETAFSTQGWEKAWDQLSEYIDFLTEQGKTA